MWRDWLVGFMVFNATFNNISIILRWSVLLEGMLSHNVVSSTPRTTLVVIGTDCKGSCKSNYHTITPKTARQALVGTYLCNIYWWRHGIFWLYLKHWLFITGELAASCQGQVHTTRCDVIDQKDGNYLIRLFPSEATYHTLTIKYDHEHVPGKNNNNKNKRIKITQYNTTYSLFLC